MRHIEFKCYVLNTSDSDDSLVLESRTVDVAFTVETPDEWRKACYETQLKGLIGYFNLRLSRIPFCVRSSLLKDLAQNIIPLLDKQVIEFLDRDIKEYHPKKGMSRASLQHLSAAEAKSSLDRYFFDEHTSASTQGLDLKEEGTQYSNFSRNMRTKYPEFFPLLSRLLNNYKNSINLVIDRVTKDFQLLCQAFFSPSAREIKWTHITATGSDLHKQGQQVLILNFSYKNIGNLREEADLSISSEIKGQTTSETLNIVYKPGSVQADAMLVGDIVRLGAIKTSEYKDAMSCIEILNKGLKHKGKRPLPTYLIVPMQDTSLYGYIEFLVHSPWQHVDYRALYEEHIRKTAPRHRHILNEVQTQINSLYTQQLTTAAEQKECDYIVEKEEDVNQYVYDCGSLLALMICMGITDMHCENVFIRKGRPMLIDLEVSFVPQSPAIYKTDCFHAGHGSMSRYAQGPAQCICLIDILGKQEQAFNHPERNRVFQLYQKRGKKLVACQPQGDLLVQGFTDALEIFSQEKMLVEKWLTSQQVKNMQVRYLPFATAFLYKILEVYVTNNFNEKMLVSACSEFFQGEKEKYTDYFESKDGDSKESDNDDAERIYRTIRFPDYKIFSKKNLSSGIVDEIKCLSVPFYYMQVDKNHLYDASGKRVKLLAESKSQSSGRRRYHYNFFGMTPLSYIQERVRSIVKNPQICARLVTELRVLPPQLSKAMENEDCLTEISLEVPSVITAAQRRAISLQPEGALPQSMCPCM